MQLRAARSLRRRRTYEPLILATTRQYLLLVAVPATAAPKQHFFFVSSDIVVNKICDLIESRWQTHATDFGLGAWGHIQQLYQKGLVETGYSRPRAIAWMLAGGDIACATEAFLLSIFAACVYASGFGELQALLAMVSTAVWGGRPDCTAHHL